MVVMNRYNSCFFLMTLQCGKGQHSIIHRNWIEVASEIVGKNRTEHSIYSRKGKY